MHSRHDLAWLNGAGWQAALDAAAPEDRAAIAQWRDRQWPLVVTRRAPDAPADVVCLGLALPRKRRIAVRTSQSAIVRAQPALLLEDAAAPAVWLAALDALRAQARSLRLRVYGSLALQTITQQPYLSPTSDIDLLFQPGSRRQLAEGMLLLEAHAQRLPLDGEIIFPGDCAVAWKEWASALAGKARVLVKDSGAVRLARTDSLLATLEA